MPEPAGGRKTQGWKWLGKTGVMKRFLTILAAFAAISGCVKSQDRSWKADAGKFTLASIFTDHMVFQQKTDAPVWGWAPEGSKVIVAPSWEKAEYSATAGEDGRWEVRIATPEAGGPYTLDVSAKGKRITLIDVMVGEVWLCSGQSNMQHYVSGFEGQGVEGSIDLLLEASEYSERIRIYDVETDKAYEPMTMVPVEWKLSTGDVLYNTSAIAYMFAKQLAKSLGVTVGIITCPWGGCKIEPWLSHEYLEKSLKGKIPDDRYRMILDRREKKRESPVQVATMYNARLYPLKGYSLKGFLWYQGCSNIGDYYYDKMQAGMAECWRNLWEDSNNELPFFFCTIAPYAYNKNAAEPLRAFFVENQLNSLDLIPNSGAAVTETLGDEGCIHPARKKEVALQLALLALDRTYGLKTGSGSGFPYPAKITFPSGSSVQEGTVRQSGFPIEVVKGDVPDGSIVVTFANDMRGMAHYSDSGGPVRGFEVAGPDRIFHPVNATAHFDDIRLDCSEIADPVAVRYAFHNFSDADLKSTFGIPVPSFRTDNWAE